LPGRLNLEGLVHREVEIRNVIMGLEHGCENVIDLLPPHTLYPLPSK
jgi:hypothetical protein